MRNKLTNIIKQYAHATHDDIINEPLYLIDEYNLTDIVDDMFKAGCIKDNQVHQVQEYDYDENKKKTGFTCPVCGFKFGINKLYQYCAKCGSKIRGWRQ